MALDSKRTALVIVDPQNDFLSEGGVVWDLVGQGVEGNHVVEHLVALREAAKQAGIPVFYSPHTYSDQEFESWQRLNPIDQVMFDRKMFRTPGWGSEWHPDLIPDDNTYVLQSHKVLSCFWAGDINIQLRQRGIDTIVLCGMSANLCVESHLRDGEENGFDVIVVKDATAAAGDDAYKAALTNYGFIANEVLSTDEVLSNFKTTTTHD